MPLLKSIGLIPGQCPTLKKCHSNRSSRFRNNLETGRRANKVGKIRFITFDASMVKTPKNVVDTTTATDEIMQLLTKILSVKFSTSIYYFLHTLIIGAILLLFSRVAIELKLFS